VLVFLLIKCGKGVSKSDHGLGPVLNRVAGLIVIVLSIMLSTWAIKTSNGLAIPFSYLLIVTGVVPGLLGGWLGILLILK
jgi:hypothetical protein